MPIQETISVDNKVNVKSLHQYRFIVKAQLKYSY